MKDITGQKFGMLTVVRPSHKDSRNEWHWLCKCDCGKLKTVSGNKLRSGNTKSCGCFQESFRKSGIRKIHGMTNSRLYVTWSNIKNRCYNAKNYEYKSYGGRGIRVCQEWLDSFPAFMAWAIENGYSDELSIDRIDVDGDYCPENCRWATVKEQSLNRRDNHLVTAFGRTMTIKEWADESGLKYDTIERRLNAYGWSPEDAVSAPVQIKRRKGRTDNLPPTSRPG